MKPELSALVADLQDLETQIADMRSRIEDIAEAEEQPLRRGLMFAYIAEPAPVTEEQIAPEPHTCETCAFAWWRLYDFPNGWVCTLKTEEGSGYCMRNWRSRKTGGAPNV